MNIGIKMPELRIVLSETMDSILGRMSKKVGMKKTEYVKSMIMLKIEQEKKE